MDLYCRVSVLLIKCFPMEVYGVNIKKMFNACNDQLLLHSNSMVKSSTLRKHAYSTVLEILPQKNEIFQIKISDIVHISAQNIDCGYPLEPPRRGGSNEYPQSMF